MAKHILIIDDEESIRFTFSYLLENEGYAVDAVASFEEAMECLKSTQFDLVYLDLLLGEQSGLATLRKIKAEMPDIPVVMITGAPDSSTVEQAEEAGAFAYIPKPIRLETLLFMTEKALKPDSPAVPAADPDPL